MNSPQNSIPANDTEGSDILFEDYPYSELAMGEESRTYRSFSGNPHDVTIAGTSVGTANDSLAASITSSFDRSEALADALNTMSATSLAEELAGYRDQRQSLNLEQVVQRFNAAFYGLNTTLVGFEDTIDQARLTFACGRNMMLIGETGEAKTLFANSVFDLFEDARTFSIDVTKGTPEEAFFGMLHTGLARQGLYFHNTAASIVQAHFAFLDEFPDANSYAQRALLAVLNEHDFKKGAQHEPSALRTAIAAGNYFSSDQLLKAVHDRFAAWSFLDSGFDPMRQMLIDGIFLEQHGMTAQTGQDAKLSMAELTYINDVLNPRVQTDEQVVVPPYVVFLKNHVTAAYLQEVNGSQESTSGDQPNKSTQHTFLSKRRMAWANDFLKAHALLAGRTEVGAQDLGALAMTYTMPGDPGGHTRKLQAVIPRVLSEYSSHEDNNRVNVDYLFAARRQIREVAHALHRGEKFEMTLGQRVGTLLGLLEVQQVPFTDLKKSLRLRNLIAPTHSTIAQGLRQQVQDELHKVIERLDPAHVQSLVK